MKTLIVLLLLLTGCTYSHSKSIPPKYSYNDKVHVYDGFYKGIDGTIQDYKRCAVELDNGDVKGSWCYKISFYSEGWKDAYVSEQELTK